MVEEKGLKLGELMKAKPVRFELRKDGEFIFELENGQKVALTCDCGNTIWDTGVYEEKEKACFQKYLPCVRENESCLDRASHKGRGACY